MGNKGARITSRDGLDISVPVAQEKSIKDPTGVGDAFRAGFLMGLDWGISPQRCAEVGSLLATYVIETIGTQEYVLSKPEFVSRLDEAYGSECAQDVASHLGN